ncbi:MAG TPA: DUF4398 domain-containing protein [Gammaproteobacteria bacterium]|jgi:hypothetical protein
MHSFILRSLIVTLIAVALAACAASNQNLAPEQAMTLAETSIRQAEQVGAAEYSALELDQARQKLNRARTALQNDENEDAYRLAEQSAADAELAAVRARVGRSEKAVAEIHEGIRALQAEIRQ